MALISVILATAREEYPIIGLPNIHVFQPTLYSLEKQTFKDFEVVIVDALYPQKKKWLEERQWSFPIKYVPVHPNHRFWLDRKRWGLCGMLNTAILHCNGELIVRIDDCAEFEADYLQRYWKGYQSGYFPMAMHIRYLEGKPARLDKNYLEKGYETQRPFLYQRLEPKREEILKQVYGEEGLIRDSRYPTVKERGGHMIAPSKWFYGYSSVSMEAALKVNGYDENFDGDKSLEDMDMGNRLAMAGYDNMFLLDINHQVIEHEHEPLSADIIARDIMPIKCNYALYLLNEKKKCWRANQTRLTEEDLEFIKEESLRPPCSPSSNYYQDDCKGELFRLWASNPRIFNLREERLNL